MTLLKEPTNEISDVVYKHMFLVGQPDAYYARRSNFPATTIATAIIRIRMTP